MTIAKTLAVNAGAGLVRRAAAAALALAAAVHHWYRCERDLRHVMQLDDHLLRDVGLTREQVLWGALKREGWQWRG